MDNSLSTYESIQITPTTSQLNSKNTWDHIQARWGFRRGHHRVTPGLYALGKPAANAPVFVTANYTLSFDALRSALTEMNAYILVLDTQGINVWCAAGKGTFGTAELIKRIEACRLNEVVTTRILILPQLGAPGVAAHEVKRHTGFRVEYGPIRAEDLP
jgi:CO dehydrogenase/acetyl-CoA synthase gamma subunit (corrinoid Fe-S protein)